MAEAREAYSQSRMGLCGVVWISVLIGFIVCPLYFSYHAPGATEVTLMDDIGLSAGQVGLLFTTYSTPNLIMPVLAGISMDRFGLNATAVVLLITLGTGSVVYSLAFACEALPTVFFYMNVGRFIQGLAGECLVTWHQAACLFWFQGSHESKSIGVCLAVQNGLGSAASFFVLEWLRETSSLNTANMSVFYFCVISFLGLVGFFALERMYATYLILEKKREIYNYPCLILFCAKATQVKLEGEVALTNDAAEEVVAPTVRQALVSFPLTFWIQNLVIFFVVTVLYTSANFFPDLLVHHYGLTRSEAALCSSLLYFAMLFAPASGAIVDAYGRRVLVQHMCLTGALIGFCVMYFTEVSPWILVPFIGWCFSWAEQNAYSIVGCTFQQVDFDVAGTGFGIMGIALNGGLMLVPPLVGAVGDAYSVREQVLIYMFFMALGIATSLAVHVLDKGGLLNRSGQVEAVTATRAEATIQLA